METMMGVLGYKMNFLVRSSFHICSDAMECILAYCAANGSSSLMHA